MAIGKMIRRSLSGEKRLVSSSGSEVRKGHFAVYVGESGQEKKRFVIPVSYLKQSSFQELLFLAEKEFGFDQPTDRLTIPCSETLFLAMISRFG